MKKIKLKTLISTLFLTTVAVVSSVIFIQSKRNNPDNLKIDKNSYLYVGAPNDGYIDSLGYQASCPYTIYLTVYSYNKLIYSSDVRLNEQNAVTINNEAYSNYLYIDFTNSINEIIHFNN